MNTREPADPGRPIRHFELTPDSAWEDVQAQYRRLVQQWHPDRHPHASRAEAQSEFIEIVAAFKRLRRHYGEHGRLPPLESAPSAEFTALRPCARPGAGASLRPPSPRSVRLRSVLRSPLTAALVAVGLALALAALVLLLDARLERERREHARAVESGEH